MDILDAPTTKGVKLNTAMSDFYKQDQLAEALRRSFLFGAEMLGHSMTVSCPRASEPADSDQIGELPANVYTSDALTSADNTTAVVFLTRDSSEAGDYTGAMTDPSGNAYTSPRQSPSMSGR